MNARRGLVRTGIVASAIWVAFWIWAIVDACDNSLGKVVCLTDDSDYFVLLRDFGIKQYGRLAMFIFGVPVAAYLVGAVIFWAARLFSRQNSN
jgi:hypothetical protein